MFRVLGRAALLLCALLAPHAAAAAGPPALEAVVTQGMPWYIDAAADPPGLHVELLREAAREAGLPLHLQPSPYVRVRSSLLAGTADVAICMRDAELDRRAVLVAEVLTTNTVLATLDPAAPATLDGYAGRPVGTVRGTPYGALLDARPGIDKVEATNLAQALTMLAGGRIDALVGAEPAIRFNQEVRSRGTSVLTHVVGTQAWALYVRAGLPAERVEALRAAAARMAADGRADALLARYLGSTPRS